jgi:hypothetical protein
MQGKLLTTPFKNMDGNLLNLPVVRLGDLEEALSPGSKKELSIANSTLCALQSFAHSTHRTMKGRRAVREGKEGQHSSGEPAVIHVSTD